MTHLVIAPVLLPLMAGTLLLLLGERHRGWQRGLAIGAVAAQIVLAMKLVEASGAGLVSVYALGNWPAPFGIVLVADRLASGMLLITALLALFALLHSVLGIDARGRHFHSLFQLQLFGLNGAFLTGDLFNLFVFFEVLLLASYGLLLHGGGRLRTRAGLHVVVINLAGSTLFLFAVGTLYGVAGTLNMADLAVRLAAASDGNVPLLRAAGLLLFGVFALKAALLPLHLWLPAAYSSASASVAALFAIMTKVGVYAILRVSTLLFGEEAGPLARLFDPWLLPLALATLALGMAGAVASNTLGQQVAYLVVASVGSLLVAFGLGNEAGIAAGLYYLAHSTFSAAAFFLLADAVANCRGEMRDRLAPGPAYARPGIFGSMFFLTAVLVAGLPPLSGFLGKFMTLRAALEHAALPWVIGVMLAAALLGLIALARSGSLLFLRELPAQVPAARTPVERAVLIPVAGLLVLCLALVFGAGQVTAFARDTAGQLLQPGEYVRAVLGQGHTR